MSGNLRAGVIGLGAMGRHHARVLRQIDGVDLVAAVDSRGDTYGAVPGLQVGRTIDELLAARLDMAVVAVPTVLHEEVGVALAAAGVATMIEKPVAMTLQAAKRISEAFHSAGVLACVGHIERFNPAIAEMRRRIQRGDLGSIYQITTQRFSTFPARIGDVGVVMDLATHDINTTQWLADSPYAQVSAATAHRAGRSHEDLVTVVGRLENDSVVDHQVNWLSPMKVRQTTVVGERGAFVADTAQVTLSFWANGAVPTDWEVLQQFRGVTEGDMTRFALRAYEPLMSEHEAFRDAVRGERSDVVSLSDGVETIRIAEAVLESAESGTTQHLPST